MASIQSVANAKNSFEKRDAALNNFGISNYKSDISHISMKMHTPAIHRLFNLSTIEWAQGGPNPTADLREQL